MLLKLISWNVNGIRAVQRKNGFRFLEKEKPHVLCLQETRAAPEDVDEMLPSFSHAFWNPAGRPGYSGTATFSRVKPLSVRPGIGAAAHDREGRVLTVELDRLFVVNVYTPNSRRDLSRLPYRRAWDRAFLRFLLRLASRKPVLFCGDINVAHQEIDLARPRENRHTHGFTDQERAGFSAILKAGFIDSFRELHDEGGRYTWWQYASGARQRNVGWRIDYVVVSRTLRPALKKAFILPQVTGSDHCPVGVTLSL
ncbi:MAG TPA: exodeoxyribonuclease III [Spirochaetia bacterium]|nr:exodeoxyribonuclease III [Spirochaetia bacterium]